MILNLDAIWPRQDISQNDQRYSSQHCSYTCNTSIKTGQIPSVWKAFYIVPIPKGTNSSTDPSGYRPISLLSVGSKLLEKIMIIHNTVLASLQEMCPQPNNQWGFLPERSTSQGLKFLKFAINLAIYDVVQEKR